MTLVFGLTGGIGSGKSTVAEIFRGAGVPIVDADALARRVVTAGSPGLLTLVGLFGQEILLPSGELDRRALGARVFESDAERELLNGIVHPLVRREAEREFARLTEEGHPVVGYDVPLLFETGQEANFRPVVVVSIPEPAQVARVMRRDGLSEEEAEARIEAQLPLSEKASLADFVIDNSGTREETKASALRVLDALRRRASAAPPDD